MPKFTIWGRTLDTDIDFPELDSASTNSSDILIRLNSALLTIRGVEYNTWSNDCGVCVSFEHVSAHYLVRVFDSVIFLINSSMNSVEYVPYPSTDLAGLRHQFLNLLLPLLFSADGHFVLHGSAVSKNSKAVAFVGKGGAGKSTVAAFLVEKLGFSLMADDSLLVNLTDGRMRVSASYGGAKFHLDQPSKRDALRLDYHISNKLFMLIKNFDPSTRDLAAIYFLQEAHRECDVAIDEMRPKEVFLELLRFSHLLDPFNAISLVRQFEFATHAAGLSRFGRLTYPKSLRSLPALGSLVVKHAGI